MAHRPEHVVWDWNGTLLADVEAVVDASRAALVAAGLPGELDLARYRARFRRPLRSFYDDLAGGPVDDHAWDTLGTVFAAHYRGAEPDLALASGALAALARLDAAGVGQSLLSLHAHDELVDTLERRELAHRFVRVDGNRLGTDGKSAALVEHVAALGLDPGRVVLVGDTVDDAAAAAEAGTGCVLVAEHSTHHADHLRAVVPPVAVVATLPDAVDHLLLAGASPAH